MIQEVFDWASEGRRHDIPWCCGLRFGFDMARPKILPRFGSVGMRLHQVLHSGPRHTFAGLDGQGYVPCEFHLARWLLTGERPDIKQDAIK